MKIYLICLLINPLLADVNYSDLFTRHQKCEKPVLTNGKVKLTRRGRNARYKCNPSYQLVGETYATCLEGQWDKIALCVKTGCFRLPPIVNGQNLDIYRGAVIKFLCNPGYKMVGSSQIYCDGSVWNGSMPQCTAPETTTLTECDFESPNICGWTQDPLDTFNWTRKNYQTPSRKIGTGPLYDHTLGKDKGGYYMFIETSSPRKLNDIARLFSPVYTPDFVSNQPSCFIFWYHMYGATTGTLNIYVIPENVSFDGTLSPKYTKSGNQGDEWFQGFVSLSNMVQSFQIVIEALCGSSYVSDIAIDDIMIKSGTECIDLETESSSVKSDTQATSSSSTTRVQKITSTIPPYPSPPPLPTLEPSPDEESTLKYATTMPSTSKTTVNNFPTTQHDKSTTTVVGPKYIIPTEPTPITLIPITLPPTTMSINMTFASRPTSSTLRSTVPTVKATTRTITIATTTTTTTTTSPTTKLVKPLIPATTRTTTSHASTRNYFPMRITKLQRMATTTMSPPFLTTKITMDPFLKSTKAKTTTLPSTIVVHPEIEEVTESNEKPSRGKKWIEARRGPILRHKEEGLSLPSIIGILIAVILVLSAVGIAGYFYLRQRQKTYRQSCIADDSDVRFLTSDEVLDFSLARPMDDDL